MRVWSTPSSRLHQVPPGFPEVAERLDWAEEAVRLCGLEPSVPSDASLRAIDLRASAAAVHRDERIRRIQEAAAPMGGFIGTPECPVSPGTPEAAEAALATVLHAVREIDGRGDAGFALVRPPGHHATSRTAMGFCYLNNIAAAAREAQRLGRRRVFVLDIDVHHGNGTQEIFYADGEVFFCSLHEDPRMQYPGTGFPHERGEGPGLGATLNLPFGSGSDPGAWVATFEGDALEALAAHKPEILLVSAGFDSHRADPLGGLLLEGDHYRRAGSALSRVARALGLPVLFILEGGYDPDCFHDGMRLWVEGWLAAA